MHGSAASSNHFVGSLMGGLPGIPGSYPYAVVEDDVGQMTVMILGCARGTRDAPGDDGCCAVNCCEGNI
jgi:hypothetical protein